jgi:hypothetical protein
MDITTYAGKLKERVAGVQHRKDFMTSRGRSLFLNSKAAGGQKAKN